MGDKPDLFGYIDYRAWLADLSEHLKATTRYFSHRWFAQAVGARNPSLFSQILSGKRNLSEAMVDPCAKAFELAPKEALYFRHLVAFCQATTALAKQEHYAVLRELSGAAGQTLVGEEAWDFYRHWWISAVRELLEQRRAFGSYEELAGWVVPPISPRQAREAVEFLETRGWVRRNGDGFWHQVQRDLTSGDEVRSLAIRSHNREMARLGLESIDRFDPSQRHASGITLGLTRSEFEMIAAEIQAFRDRVVRLSRRNRGGGDVFQFNVQLFPLTQGGKGR